MYGIHRAYLSKKQLNENIERIEKMAEFSALVITEKGQSLLAKIIAGSTGIEFTKIASSNKAYEPDQLVGLTELEDVRQTSLISNKEIVDNASIKVEAAFSNEELTTGYYMRSLGLYAIDPGEGEIVYAVTVETTGNCYMPAYNGATVSGANIQLYTTVGNAENISMEVDPAAAATVNYVNDVMESHKSGGDHDDRYYTEEETDGLLENKIDKSSIVNNFDTSDESKIAGALTVKQLKVDVEQLNTDLTSIQSDLSSLTKIVSVTVENVTVANMGYSYNNINFNSVIPSGYKLLAVAGIRLTQANASIVSAYVSGNYITTTINNFSGEEKTLNIIAYGLLIKNF